jgi:hypothetical protein
VITAQTKLGSRQAMSQPSGESAAEIQPASGGFVAIFPVGVC